MATIIIVAMAVVVLLASEFGGAKGVAVTLGFFLIADVVFYETFTRWLPKVLHETENVYVEEEDIIGLDQVKVLMEYTRGRWHYGRFLSMAAGIFIVNVVCFYYPAQKIVSSFLSYIIEMAAEVPESMILPSVPGLVILLYVVLFDAWQWYKRVKTHLFLGVLDEIRLRYEVRLKRG